MNRTVRTIATATGLGALLATGVAAYAAAAPEATPPSAASATATPSAELRTALTFAREEERMARDLYAAIAERYDGARPFSMVTRSEQQHTDAVLTLLQRYGIPDPAAGRAAGSYADPAIQSLYDTWWAQASTSQAAADRVGVALETRDIADLERMVAGSLPSDVDAVLGRLLTASHQHLSAFSGATTGQTMGPGRAEGTGRSAGTGMGRAVGGQGRGPGAGTADGTCPMLADRPLG